MNSKAPTDDVPGVPMRSQLYFDPETAATEDDSTSLKVVFGL